MRREYLEDAVLVIGGAVVIAGAWLLYWQAGVIVAGLVCMLLAIMAYRHRFTQPHNARDHAPAQEHERMGAAAWRFHPPDRTHQHGTGGRA